MKRAPVRPIACQRIIRPVTLSEVEGSTQLRCTDCDPAVKRMSFRAVEDGVASSPDGGILPITVWLRSVPALDVNATIPQLARPFDFAQGDTCFRFRWFVIGLP